MSFHGLVFFLILEITVFPGLLLISFSLQAIIDEFEQRLRACHTRGLDAMEELEIGQGGSQRAPSAKKQSSGVWGSPAGGQSGPSPQMEAPRSSLFGLMPLPSLVSRHQHLTPAASDNDFVTPEPRRPARRHPNTQQRASKRKPRIVFSSDESSEEGGALPPAQPGRDRAYGGWFGGGCCVVSTCSLESILFLQCGLGLSHLFSEVCFHHLCDSAFSYSSNSLNRAFSRDDRR